MVKVNILKSTKSGEDSKVVVIKDLRQITGSSLKEAKETTDVLMEEQPVKIEFESELSDEELAAAFVKGGFVVQFIGDDYDRIADHIKDAMKIALELEDLKMLQDLSTHLKEARSK